MATLTYIMTIDIGSDDAAHPQSEIIQAMAESAMAAATETGYAAKLDILDAEIRYAGKN
jgi:hypothetical protein